MTGLIFIVVAAALYVKDSLQPNFDVTDSVASKCSISSVPFFDYSI
jgi:hypothetical protein